jgi:carbon-monoxide dehydrogenase iron sulfur subunit
MTELLMIHPDKCTGCKNCVLACSFAHEKDFRPAATRIHVFTWEREGISVPMMCQQCGDAPCISVCPTGAMHRMTDGGVVDWDIKKCILCKMCTQACPFGNAVYDSLTNSILKCDECEGDPACVRMCPNKALEFVEDTISTRTCTKAFAGKFKEAFKEVA